MAKTMAGHDGDVLTEDTIKRVNTLAEVYGFEARLAAIYPGNNNVRPKIRQQLQVLRDMGWLEFNGRGTYRRTT